MKTKPKIWNEAKLHSTRFAFLCCVILATRAAALDVIDPSGASYVNVSDDSHFNESYVAANLFNYNVAGIGVGTVISDGNEFARSGAVTSFVAFELDQAYSNIGTIFHAQRGGTDPNLDKISQVSVWVSGDTPFTAADPGTAAAAVAAITNTQAGYWGEYFLSTPVAGRYFLLKLDQASPGGNPGGRELRLGAALGQPPGLVLLPENKAVYQGGTARFNVTTTGTAPLVYQWIHGSNPLVNGGRISGADTANLVVTGAIPADSGSYSLAVTNSYGSNGALASLTVVIVPTNAATTAILSNAPVAYWQLNESAGSTTALDLAGSYNGSYGILSGVAATGPQPPVFPGFSSTNTAVQTTAFTIDSTVTLPALNLSTTNSLSIVAWIYADGSAGPQQPYTGIVYCRGAGTSAGLICSSDGSKLGYQWGGSRYFFDSGLFIPTNQWTMVALVYTTNATTLYCGTTNGLVLSATDAFAQGGQSFGFTTYIGLDTDLGGSARTFNGVIDDVAFFDRALSKTEIGAIYSAGTGLVPTLQIISQTTNQTVFQGEQINLDVNVSGLSPVYQWYKQSAPILGATNDTYIVNQAKVTDSGSYYLVATNQTSSVTSAVITVTVPSYLIRPLNPQGNLYTAISDNSHFDSSYTAASMFQFDVTGIPVGAFIFTDAVEYARQGDGVCFVAFQVDRVYTNIGAIFYAQRFGTVDHISQISIWTSETTPFIADDPGTAPEKVISVNSTGAIWERYVLDSTLAAKYLLVKFDQANPGSIGNPGGRELRLGVPVTPSSLTLSTTPGGLVLTWLDGTLLQADSLAGPWTPATGITNGVPFSATAGQRFYRIQY